MFALSDHVARVVAVVAASCSLAHAQLGPLTPPAGAVSNTSPHLGQIDPRIPINADNTPGDSNSVFKITQSGSYYLRGNITVLLAETAIKIEAEDVTVDLMGFEIRGFDLGSLHGVSTSGGPRRNIHLRNGTIQGFGGHGVAFELVRNAIVEDLRVSECGGRGIRVGDSGLVRGCVVRDNAEGGIHALGNACVVTACSVEGNAQSGIIVGGGSVVVDCAANETTGTLSVGVSAGAGSVVARCVARDNEGDGFRAGNGSVVESCVAFNNGAHGINVDSDCLIRNNACYINGPSPSGGVGAGILTTLGRNRIEGNVCGGNVTGISANGSSNVVVANVCSDSTTANYDLASGTLYGPIIDLSGVVSAPVSGSSAPGVLGSSDPWANFAH